MVGSIFTSPVRWELVSFYKKTGRLLLHAVAHPRLAICRIGLLRCCQLYRIFLEDGANLKFGISNQTKTGSLNLIWKIDWHRLNLIVFYGHRELSMFDFQSNFPKNIFAPPLQRWYICVIIHCNLLQVRR